MSGNRWEWCWDWFDPDYYAYSPEVDPTGPDEIPKTDFVERARRSSSAVEDAETLRTSYRSADFINYPGDNGLRLVRTA
jgi:formylglycine-generating enzyme required for sulfatase activity